MRVRPPWVIGAGAGVLAGLAVAILWLGLERVEDDVEVGFQGEARRNPLLAAERLLEELGLPTRTTAALLPLPPPNHLLVLVAPRRTMGPTRAGMLLDWVAAGGHLVVTPRRAGRPTHDFDDPLLATLGIWVERAPPGDRMSEEGSPRGGGRMSERYADLQAYEVLEVSPGPGHAPLQVRQRPWPRLHDDVGEAQFAAGPEDGRVLLRYSWGDGFVTVLSDARFLENDEIGLEGHARFLWAVATAVGAPEGVVLSARDRVPSLLSRMVVQGWPAMVAAAALALLWAWRQGARFGPLLPPPTPERRSLLEHVEASGELVWRHRRGQELLAAARRRLWRCADRRHPGFGSLPERERVRRLAALGKVPPGALAVALEERAPADSDELTRTIATLEQIRRSL